MKPHGKARYRVVAAGWLAGGHLGRLRVVFSRQGSARKIRGLVTDDAELSAAELLQTYDRRWTIEPGVKDLKPLLGLGHYQHRSYRAAVTHRHLVGFAYALLPPLRIARNGAQGQRTDDTAADRSIAAAQEQLRRLIWEDWVAYLKEKSHGKSVIEELARLRVA